MTNSQISPARAQWRKSSRSNQQAACVEVADLAAAVGVRDSKDPSGPVLTFSRQAVADLAHRIREGHLDL
ncbi:hypothetical protein BJF79_30655 [Actinomadura sp. CNU-125]|uniref:DUF397 domain-containing protein n=1 Tax=Actinomadura sp. CNU-125 TaxID=1904961 RepID=UPI0009688AC1|nr:DUF397 domain-containing protein [Actinomadura sp. CNU-125]OLT36761.1 hypothetical protein BJF79_30655 [Actinomadura sp. CNU-125]